MNQRQVKLPVASANFSRQGQLSLIVNICCQATHPVGCSWRGAVQLAVSLWMKTLNHHIAY